MMWNRQITRDRGASRRERGDDCIRTTIPRTRGGLRLGSGIIVLQNSCNHSNVMRHDSRGRKDSEYEKRAEKMDWAELGTLWHQIKNGQIKDWDPGKALEYLIVRAFALSSSFQDFLY